MGRERNVNEGVDADADEEPLLPHEDTQPGITGSHCESESKPRRLPAAVVNIIVAYFIMAFHTICFDQFFPMFLSASKVYKAKESLIHVSGGLGISPSETGMALSAAAIVSIAVIAVAFAPVVSRLGTVTAVRLSSWLYPLAYLLVPYLVFLPAGNGQQTAASWSGVATVLFLKTFAAAFTFTGVPILLQTTQHDTSRLGLTNGIAQVSLYAVEVPETYAD